ncbi:MAG: ATP-grasp domain-containing protein [Deltaproteobacteria bacterium]|nr:ATP-grasp domain-containing protein [Deltaproteobacteria bacterium]
MMEQRQGEVFITDGHWRKTLAAVRALGKKGVGVTVGETTWLATAAFSRYCCHRVRYPSPLLDPEGFVDRLLSLFSRNRYRLLLPMEDATLELVSRHLKDFSQWTYLPIVPPEKLAAARDKGSVLRLAGRLGIPSPKTWRFRDPAEVERVARKLPYPLVIKPRISSGALGVSYVHGPEALAGQYRAIHRIFPFPLIQEYIPREGAGFGASILMDENHRVRASFVHKRLREYPVSGGASTLRESVRRDDLLEMARTLLEALEWTGVAMVEFKLDPRDGICKLMEINPRFWGSLALAIASGVNFPYLLYRMSLGENFPPVDRYKVGVRCRWLLPGDILHFLHNPRRMKLNPSFFRFFDRKTSYDILSLKDPLPTLGRLLTPLTFLYDRDMKARLRQRRI